MIPYEKLDKFQKVAIQKLKEGNNVIVTAPTGTGKTAIIDHILVDWFREGFVRVIYTAPLKALCNQKFRDFSSILGSDLVGIITGDEVVNENAYMLVMTTEVLRNMLQEEVLDFVPKLVIFDEIHYISDMQRGAVWEESIVLLPSEVQILGLSATIPNAHEIATWIEVIKGRKTVVVSHEKRAVPLKIFGVTKQTGIVPFKRARRFAERARINKKVVRSPSHIELVGELEERGMLPVLYFLFNRKKVEAFAREISRFKTFTTNVEKRLIRDEINSYINEIPDDARPFIEKMKPVLIKGVGFHHAGLIPHAKRLVEILFEKRLLKVVYCTSTFALGVNMPARSVCFDSIYKFDGISFRPLKNIEFFQKAGRAGRRGMDTEGYVFVRLDTKEYDEIPYYDESLLEPVESMFKLSYNSVVNLLAREDMQRIQMFLNSSFWSFQHEDQKSELKGRLLEYKKKLEDIEEVECVYNPELYDIRKEEILMTIENNKNVLKSIDDLLSKPNISSRKKRRLREKKKGLVLQIEELSRELEEMVPESCPFCENRVACRAIRRKKRYFEKKIKKIEKQLHFIDSYLVKEFEGKCQVLEELGYISGRDIKMGGEIVRRIHIEELLIAEMMLEGFFDRMDPSILCGLFACIGREVDKLKGVKSKHVPSSVKNEVDELCEFIKDVEDRYIDNASSGLVNWSYFDCGYLWGAGEDLYTIVKRTGMYEGDIISTMRQALDVARQLKRAYAELAGFRDMPAFRNIKQAYDMIDRSILREFSP